MIIRVDDKGYITIEGHHRCLKDPEAAAHVLANLLGVLSIGTHTNESSVDATRKQIDALGRELERRDWCEWKGA